MVVGRSSSSKSNSTKIIQSELDDERATLLSRKSGKSQTEEVGNRGNRTMSKSRVTTARTYFSRGVREDCHVSGKGKPEYCVCKVSEGEG